VISAPDFKSWLHDQGAEAVTSSPQELGAFVKAELAQYAVIVRKSGIRAD
jgi:tripartite-type tricarboxylate transporter receptor subunit TctC